MSDFKIPPVSTLIGSPILNFFKVIQTGKVGPRYYHKVFLTFLVCLISVPFHLFERLMDGIKMRGFMLKEPPLFILGHWRSGTTHLHNLLCQQPGMGYFTTYLSVFPSNLHSKWLFRTFMKINMPDKRPSDNVKLGIDLPQEDEFAMSNFFPNSFYNFFYFPKSYDKYYREAIQFEGVSSQNYEGWKRAYKKLIMKATWEVGARQIVVKNPVNTGRVKQLLDLYPEAKFLHIGRNPVVVYLSTKKFFISLYPTLQLQDVDSTFIIDMIFDLYERLYQDYLDQRASIPNGRLLEIKFEDFEKDPVASLKMIYEELSLPGYEEAVPHFESYLKGLGEYRKNTYEISAEELERIQKKWGFAMEEFQYEIPDNVKVV